MKMTFLFAGIYILTELIFVSTGLNENENIHVIAFGLNSLCLLLAVAISILVNFNRHKGQGLSMVVDLKTGIRVGVFYALIISSFCFCYYQWIDPEYPERRRQQLLEVMATEESQQILKDHMDENPDFNDGKSLDDRIEQNEESVNFFLVNSSSKVFTMTLISLLLLGRAYSFAIMALNRLILAKL